MLTAFAFGLPFFRACVYIFEITDNGTKKTSSQTREFLNGQPPLPSCHCPRVHGDAPRSSDASASCKRSWHWHSHPSRHLKKKNQESVKVQA